MGGWYKDGHWQYSEGPTMADVWAKEATEHKAQEQRMIDDARADAKAVWALADHYYPTDWDEFAKRNGLRETLREMWRNAFITGWRAAFRDTDGKTSTAD